MSFELRIDDIIADGVHLLGKIEGNLDGKTLIVFGGIHGNEAGGVFAIERVLRQLKTLDPKRQGRAFFLAGNTRALLKGTRFIDSDLNRHWTEANLFQNEPTFNFDAKISEDIEQKELLLILHDIIRTARDDVFVLDLHSTSAGGVPFATLGDTLRNRSFAQKFPITLLLGIEEQLDGTVLEYLNDLGAVTLGFEGGQHQSESTIDSHEALIWLALAESGCISKEEIDYSKHFSTLKKVTGKGRIVEIRHREIVEPERDGFEMSEGYENFQPITKGEVLAHNDAGEIKANESGLILMPLYQKLGNDGFFIGREVAGFWLWISGVLRKSHFADMIHFLPGVSRDLKHAGTFIVNTNVARILPLQILHLLGFRKLRWIGEKLVVSRRLHDTRSPFL